MKCHYWLIVRHLVISLLRSAQFFSCITSFVNSHGIKLSGIFVAREKKIATDIDSAENARQEAEILVQKRQEELAAARTEATQIIDEAKKTGKTKESKIIAEAYDEAKRLKEKANQDIAQSWVEALAGVKGEVADLTVLLAEKVMKQNLDAKAQSDLIDSYLDQLGDA